MVSKFILRCHLGDVLKSRGITALKLSEEINCPLPTLNDLINNKHMDSQQIPAQLIANICAYFDLAPNKLFSVEKKRNFMKPYRKKYYVYPAIFNYADDGISVKFPDLPGCLTFGYSDEEALRMAREAMSLHLHSAETESDAIPEPTPADEFLLNVLDCRTPVCFKTSSDPYLTIR